MAEAKPSFSRHQVLALEIVKVKKESSSTFPDRSTASKGHSPRISTHLRAGSIFLARCVSNPRSAILPPSNPVPHVRLLVDRRVVGRDFRLLKMR